MQNKTGEILGRVKETLNTAQLGFRDLVQGPPERKTAGLWNLIVFGRAITNVLQNLRSVEPGFDGWYNKYVEEMKSDPLMRFFYMSRSEVLKEGKLEHYTRTHIKEFHYPQDLQRFGPPPPNAKGFFMGDRNGGSGWEVQLPDGSVEKLYVDLPVDIAEVSLGFPNSPESHLGRKIEDPSIENLGGLYFSYLERLVASAEKEFRTGG